MNRFLAQLTCLAVCLIPTAALAHPGAGTTSGLAHGFMHPLSGLDHQLAMVLVGILAFQLGGRALWLLPLSFVSATAFGGILGVVAAPVPFVESGIALSVVLLGAVVAFGIKPPVAVAMAVAGLFAIFHGHAHGTEMPLDVSGVAYAAGFIAATALLHAVGICLGYTAGVFSQISERQASIREIWWRRLVRCGLPAQPANRGLSGSLHGT